MPKIPFIKYQGAGNDFVVLEGHYLDPSVDLSSLSAFLCDRRKGIGADGLLVLTGSAVADYRMRIFNADGSEPSMCGNGAYCLIDYISRFISPFTTLSLETKHAILQCRKIGEEIALNLGPVSILHFPIHLEANTPCYVVNTGVPHAVLWTDQLNQIDLDNRGRELRFDPRFAPDGVNVNFVQLTQRGALQMRTYERGVEGETLACGTGAAAVAFVAKQLYRLPCPIYVETRSDFYLKEIEYVSLLKFLFSSQPQGDTAVEMIGSAQVVFEGSVEL